ncbi:peptidoglycan DD-metalloendopeptidase family protein [Exiguobacterium qingdaonense]|uniref:peptidoglycan DD-metalloendopeptidase family protein n=1 Tax=Exiguobacterium qingdaonense TaxID=2751251 RepID=UPI001BE97BB9|nr:peptidoglycan DD-metalloendopeptidase family protein [Exiguobacterium qingdaonense]
MKRKIIALFCSVLFTIGIFTPTGTSVEAATTYNVKVTTNSLNVRSGPGTTYKIVGSAKLGQSFKYLGVSGGWTKITFNGNSRYVSSTYVKKYSVSTVSTTSTAKMIIPTKGTLTQKYGPASGQYGYTFHNGIDLGAPRGTPVVAAASGQVTVARNYGAYGNYIMMTHQLNGQTYITVYAHLDRINVVKGQTLAKGATIGTVGNTGNSFGNHLHFEVHRNSYVYSSSSPANSINPYTMF